MYFLLMYKGMMQARQTSVFYLCQKPGADSPESGVIGLLCDLGQVTFYL